MLQYPHHCNGLKTTKIDQLALRGLVREQLIGNSLREYDGTGIGFIV